MSASWAGKIRALLSVLLELENSRSAGEGAPAHNARENKGEQGLNSSISYIYALLYYLLSRYLIIIYLINTAACMLNSGFRHVCRRTSPKSVPTDDTSVICLLRRDNKEILRTYRI